MGFTAVNKVKNPEQVLPASQASESFYSQSSANVAGGDDGASLDLSKNSNVSDVHHLSDVDNVMKLTASDTTFGTDAEKNASDDMSSSNAADKSNNKFQKPWSSPGNAAAAATYFANPFIYPQTKGRSNPALDMASTTRRGDYIDTSTRFNADEKRVYDLEEVPVLHPTMAEFADPIAYVQSIYKQGDKYGMVKIIPPSQWALPFCLDTEFFWFKTRRQNLSLRNLQHSAASDFVESLYYFHRLGRNNLSKLPSIDKRPLDLFHLHQCVQLRGGFEEVCKKKLWAQIGRELGYSGRIMTSLSTSLKSAYQKLLYPYDQYLAKKKANIADGIHIPAFKSPHRLFSPNGQSPNDEGSGDAKSSAKRTYSEIQSSDESSADVLTDGIASIKLPNGIQLSSTADAFISESERSTQVYPHVTASQSLLRRIAPFTGIPSVPDDPTIPPFDNWHEGLPVMTGDESCFELRGAPSYNLRQFQQKAAMLKTNYFASKIKQENGQSLSQYQIEEAYWKLLNDPSQNVEVEYGLDIHSSVQGTAFSKPEANLHDAAILEPWNLNNVPFNRPSIFEFVSSDIPYMCEPWINVGMIFSTKSWHFEDYFSYLMHYHHFGDTKTWYSIPAEDYDKYMALLEQITGSDKITKNPKSLLESQYMLSPDFLKEHGIRCYAVNQNPGEYVVTFPKSLHAEMNHGFNYSELVNFLEPEHWFDYGFQSLELYNKNGIEPPFSIARTLFNLSNSNSTITASSSFIAALAKVVNQELELRQELRSKYPNLKEVKVLDDGQERKCKLSNDLCYLSFVSTAKWAYSLKAFLSADSLPKSFVFKYIMDDDELRNCMKKSSDLGSQSTKWYTELNDYLRTTPRPDLRVLQKIVTEGEAVDRPANTLFPLKRFVVSAVMWVSKVEEYLNYTKEKPPLPAEEFQKLLDESSAIMFQCSAADQLREKAIKVQQYRKRVLHLLLGTRDIQPKPLDQYTELLETGKSFHIDLVEIKELEKVVRRILWNENARNRSEKVTDLAELRELVREGDTLGISPEADSVMATLYYCERAGTALELRARDVFQKETLQISDVKAILTESAHYPIMRDTRAKLEDIISQEEGITEQIQDLVRRSQDQDPYKRPSFSEAYSLINISWWLGHHITANTIEEKFKLVKAWIDHGKWLFGRATDNFHVLNDFLEQELNKTLNVLSLEKSFENDLRKDVEGSSFDGNIYISNKAELMKGSSGHDSTIQGGNDNVAEPRFCICRQGESDWMIKCSSCNEWYHGKCVGATKDQYRETEYHCPVCDWKTAFPKSVTKVRLAVLQSWIEEGEKLPYLTEELKTATRILDAASKYRLKLHTHVMYEGRVFTPSDIDMIKYYIRVLAGSDIVLGEEMLKLYSFLKLVDLEHYNEVPIPTYV